MVKLVAVVPPPVDAVGLVNVQFVSRERENTFLIAPIPIRERTAHDVNDNGTIRLAHRICAKVSYRALRCCFVFLLGAF